MSTFELLAVRPTPQVLTVQDLLADVERLHLAVRFSFGSDRPVENGKRIMFGLFAASLVSI